MRKLITLSLSLLLACAAVAQEPAPVALPTPRTDGGKPLLQALKERQSRRDFAPDPLPAQLLSDLLWAAWGINRPDGRRTAPTARNRQEIDVYVTTAEGAYLYDAKANRLMLVAKEDLRAATGMQPFVAEAPVNLVFVARLPAGGNVEDNLIWAGSHAGYISQNVYLFCASEGLATVVRGMVNREALAKALKLAPDRKVILAQTVGYPKKG